MKIIRRVPLAIVVVLMSAQVFSMDADEVYGQNPEQIAGQVNAAGFFAPLPIPSFAAPLPSVPFFDDSLFLIPPPSVPGEQQISSVAVESSNPINSTAPVYTTGLVSMAPVYTTGLASTSTPSTLWVKKKMPTGSLQGRVASTKDLPVMGSVRLSSAASMQSAASSIVSTVPLYDGFSTVSNTSTSLFPVGHANFALNKGYDVALVTKLCQAASSGDIESVRILLSQGVNPNVIDRSGEMLDGATPLCAAIFKGNEPIIELLLKAGANPNQILLGNRVGLLGYAPLHLAVKNNCLEIVKLLLDYKADVNLPIKNPSDAFDTFTPLCLAAYTNGVSYEVNDINRSIIAILLQHKALVDYVITAKKEWAGFTPLLIAIKKAKIFAIRSLVGAGATLNEPLDKKIFDSDVPAQAQQTIQSYLLHIADTQRLLVLSKALNTISNTPVAKQTAEQIVLASNSLETAGKLIKQGADVNCRDIAGATPLHYAVGIGDAKNPTYGDLLVTLLLKHIPDHPNKIDNANQTPLSLAVSFGNKRVIKELIKAGADPLVPVGASAMDIAIKKDDKEIIAMLKAVKK